MNRMITIPEGTMVNRSELGYYNFQYPARATTKVNREVDVKDLNWITYSDKFAVLVPVNALSKKTEGGEEIVVWLDLKWRKTGRYV